MSHNTGDAPMPAVPPAPRGFTPAPLPVTPPGPPQPCAMKFAASVWKEWSFWFDHPTEQVKAMLESADSGASQVIKGKRSVRMPDPSNEFNGLTHRCFNYNNVTLEHSQVCIYKDKSTQINAMSIQEFLEHPSIEPIVTNPNMVSSIDYVLTKTGNEAIEEEEAFFNSKHENYDPSKKPRVSRPGKRALSPQSSTVQASRQRANGAGGSTSRAAQ